MVTASIVAIVALILIGLWQQQRGTHVPEPAVRSEFQPVSVAPSNELERSIANAPETFESVLGIVLNNQWLVLENEAEPGRPMTFSASFPASFQNADESDEVVTFGPWVLAFSSSHIVSELTSTSFLKQLLETRNVISISGRELANACVELGVPLNINLFTNAEIRIEVHDLQKALSVSPEEKAP